MVEFIYLESKPMLNVIDEGKKFLVLCSLLAMSRDHVWNIFKLCSMDVYARPPEIIVHDAIKNFDSEKFRNNAQLMAIHIIFMPVEATQLVELIERYYGPLRRTYQLITKALKNEPAPRESRLQLVVKPTNDTGEHDGIISTLLVFRAFTQVLN